MQGGKVARKTRLQRALEDRDITQADIARECDLSEPTISRILLGSYRMHDVRSRATVVRVLRLVSAKIDVPLEELASERGITADLLASSLTRLERIDAAAGAAA